MTVDTESVTTRFSRQEKMPLPLAWMASGAFVAVLLAPMGTASAIEGLRFEARASAAQEVQDPPVDSGGSARGRFTFANDLSELAARVDVADLIGTVAAAHLHCAPAGVNGPIIVNLLPTTGGTDGRIVDDDFDNEDISDVDCTATCGFEINNIASLRAAAEDGCLYLNVHTSEFVDGEVRGQLLVR